MKRRQRVNQSRTVPSSKPPNRPPPPPRLRCRVLSFFSLAPFHPVSFTCVARSSAALSLTYHWDHWCITSTDLLFTHACTSTRLAVADTPLIIVACPRRAVVDAGAAAVITIQRIRVSATRINEIEWFLSERSGHLALFTRPRAKIRFLSPAVCAGGKRYTRSGEQELDAETFGCMENANNTRSCSIVAD